MQRTKQALGRKLKGRDETRENPFQWNRFRKRPSPKSFPDLTPGDRVPKIHSPGLLEAARTKEEISIE